MASILYVDDEENDVLFMRRAFRRAGMEQALKVVVDGQAAIDYLSGGVAYADRVQYPLPDAVVLDLNLPRVSGFDVLDWIRHQRGFEALPVFIFSSSPRPEDRLKARQLGATGYLEKPNSGLDFGVVLEQTRKYWLPPARSTTLVGGK